MPSRWNGLIRDGEHHWVGGISRYTQREDGFDKSGNPLGYDGTYERPGD